MFPAELVDHELWWEGPTIIHDQLKLPPTQWLELPPTKWLKLLPTQWPSQSHVEQVTTPEEEKEISLHTLLEEELLPLFPLDRYSNYLRVKYVTA